MLKMLALAAVVATGAGFGVAWAGSCEGGACEATTPVVLASATTTTAPAEKIAVGNTKCIVMPEDETDGKTTVEYQGKLYGVCCKGCIKKFNKEPEKYVKALEADPAKYGVKK